MRWVHRVTLTALAKPEEDVAGIRDAFRALIPFNLEEAKVQFKEEKAEGFDDRIIKIFTVILTKESYTNDFLQFLLDNLSDEQKNLLVSQAESRLDENFDFFIRVDKDAWLKERKMRFTDSGNCFHMKFSLATYPKRRDSALELIQKLFSQKTI